MAYPRRKFIREEIKAPAYRKSLYSKVYQKILKKVPTTTKTVGYTDPRTGIRTERKERIKIRPSRTQILRSLEATYPVKVTQRSSRGRVKEGRGRPKGSYTYFIPGRGKVDVFTYRRWLREQRNQQKQQFQQQLTQISAQQKAYAQQYPEMANQQIPLNRIYGRNPYQQPQNPYQQFQPQPQNQWQPAQPVQPSLKEISILERTPVNLGAEGQDTFVELDFVTGQPKIRRRGNLL